MQQDNNQHKKNNLPKPDISAFNLPRRADAAPYPPPAPKPKNASNVGRGNTQSAFHARALLPAFNAIATQPASQVNQLTSLFHSMNVSQQPTTAQPSKQPRNDDNNKRPRKG